MGLGEHAISVAQGRPREVWLALGWNLDALQASKRALGLGCGLGRIDNGEAMEVDWPCFGNGEVGARRLRLPKTDKEDRLKSCRWPGLGRNDP